MSPADIDAAKAWADKGPYHIQGQVEHYDTEGHGKTLDQALRDYARDCDREAANYEQLAAKLRLEAQSAYVAAAAAEAFWNPKIETLAAEAKP